MLVPVLLTLLLLLPLLRGAVPNMSAVAGGCYVEINGAGSVEPRLFGVTAYEGGGILNTDEGEAWLREWGVTSLGSPALFQYFDLPANLSETQISQWLDVRGGGWRAFQQGSGSPGHLVAQWVPRIIHGGAEPFLYLYGGLPGSSDPGDPQGNGLDVPRNGTMWGAAAAGAIRLVRAAAANASSAPPPPPIRFVHLANEPNNFMWKWPNCSCAAVGACSCDPWMDYYSAAATRIKAELPDIQIGGPVLCWGPGGENQRGQRDWYTWWLWSKPALSRGLREGTLDYFDFHAYDKYSLANRLLADVHTVAAFSRAETGGSVLLRSAITETSFALPASATASRVEHFARRTLPIARDILSLAAHPDKVGGAKQSTFCMARRKTMITIGSPYFVWINTNEIISSFEPWYLLGAVCDPPTRCSSARPTTWGSLRTASTAGTSQRRSKSCTSC
jgi:hypothetical protein